MKLFSFERRWLMTVFDATFSGGVATLPWKASELRTTQAFVTDVFRVGPPITMVGMRAAIWLVYLFTPLLAFALPIPLGMLSEERRSAALEKLSMSNIYELRELPTLFKMMGSMAYCSSAEVQRAVGIERPDFRVPNWVEETERHG